MTSTMPKSTFGRLLLTIALAATQPLSVAHAQGLRLTKEVFPTEAAVELSVDANSPVFSGTARFSLTVAKAVPSFRMHQEALKVALKQFSKNGQAVELTLTPGPGNELTLTSKQPLEPGAYELVLGFEGKVSPKSDHGVFAEQEGGNKLLYTQFEAISARAAFPCFDQPDFKHPWSFSISAPSSQQVFFNTNALETKVVGKSTTHLFEKTLPLPSYLIAFAAGTFDVIDLGKGTRNQVPMRVIVPKGLSRKTHWVTQEMKRVIEGVENYFDLPYPYSKLDALVIPHLASFGAMEHPGLVTYSARVLLQNEADETLDFRQGATETMAHEFAHQWFGDFVTLEYWNDIWLNEAFAQWLGRRVADTLHPEWKYGKEAVYGVGNAMQADRIKSARKIRQPIETEGDIETAFDGITYQKGAAVISTVERWMGAKTFQSKVKAYMLAHANGNATSTQFFEAFGTFEKTSVRDVFVGFTDTTGIPLIGAEKQCEAGRSKPGKNNIRFTVSRYESRPPGSSAGEASWKIPICYRLANGKEGCLLSNETLALPDDVSCEAPVQLNRGGLGYYLVDVSAAELDGRFAAAQSSEERITFARELSYAITSGRIDFGAVLPSAEKWMQVEDWPWRRALAGILNKVDRWRLPASLQGEYGLFIARAIGPVAKQVGWQPQPGESPDITAIRPLLLSVMVTEAESKEFIEQAGGYAAAFFSGKKPSFEVSEIALPLAVESQPTVFFAKSKTRWMAEKDVAVRRMLQDAMQSVRVPELAQQAAQIALNPKLDARETASFWYGHPLTAKTRFDFAEKNAVGMFERLPAKRGGSRVISALGGGLCDPQGAERLEAFFRPRLAELTGGERYLKQTKERILDCHELNSRLIPQLSAYLQNKR